MREAFPLEVHQIILYHQYLSQPHQLLILLGWWIGSQFYFHILSICEEQDSYYSYVLNKIWICLTNIKTTMIGRPFLLYLNTYFLEGNCDMEFENQIFFVRFICIYILSKNEGNFFILNVACSEELRGFKVCFEGRIWFVHFICQSQQTPHI